MLPSSSPPLAGNRGNVSKLTLPSTQSHLLAPPTGRGGICGVTFGDVSLSPRCGESEPCLSRSVSAEADTRCVDDDARFLSRHLPAAKQREASSWRNLRYSRREQQTTTNNNEQQRTTTTAAAQTTATTATTASLRPWRASGKTSFRR